MPIIHQHLHGRPLPEQSPGWAREVAVPAAAQGPKVSEDAGSPGLREAAQENGDLQNMEDGEISCTAGPISMDLAAFAHIWEGVR